MTDNHTPTETAALHEAGLAAAAGLFHPDVIDLFGPPIHVYTRRQAIADGALIDVTDAAHRTYRQYRRFPSIAMTAAAYADTVAWNDDTEARKPEFTGQDETGRLADVLWMALLGMRAATDSDRARFRLDRVPPAGRGVRARTVELVIALSGGDDGEPVVTIMLPTED